MTFRLGKLWGVAIPSFRQPTGASPRGVGRLVQQLVMSALVALIVACGTGTDPVAPAPADGGAPPGLKVELGNAPAVSTAACVDSPLTSKLMPILAKQSPVPANTLRIHYQRGGNDYSGWGLHLWNSSGSAADTTGIEWNAPLQTAGTDDFGQYYDVPLTDTTGTIGYIFHKGDEKDHGGADQSFTLGSTVEIWRKAGDLTTYDSNPDIATVPANTLRVHYQRPTNDYSGWGLHVWNSSGSAADTTGIEWNAPLQAAGTDAFGQYYDIPLLSGSGTIGYIFHKGDEKDHGGADQSFVLTGSSVEIWRKQNDLTTYTSNPDEVTVVDGEFVRVHYKRYLGDYDGYGLHIWEFGAGQDIDTAQLPAGVQIGDWPNPVPFGSPMTVGTDSFGVYIDVPVKKYSEGARGFNFLVHKGTEDSGKDGGDRFVSLSSGYEIWLVEGDNGVYYSKPNGDISTTAAKAYWLDERTLVWPRVSSDGDFRLYYKVDGGMTLDTVVTNSSGVLNLTVGDGSDLSAAAQARIQHVPQPHVVLTLPAALSDAAVKNLLKTQLVLVRQIGAGEVQDATTPQLAGVLDTLYADAAKTATLGVSTSGGIPTFKVWAPTARGVAVCVYDSGNAGSATSVHPMSFDESSGIWTFTGSGAQNGKYYRYLVDVFVHSTGELERNVVTDPYSFSLSANSQRSWIGTPDNADTIPTGWANHNQPTLDAPEDLAIYELHVRDFSAKDVSVSAGNRGKYLAFTETGSDGMQHLQALQQAGLSMIHFLPINDQANLPETGCTTPVIPADAPDAETQQAAVNATRDSDCFNWGYDPLHYTAIEGSYASDPADGAVRVKEFRQAVQALHEAGLQVAVDVVYNHTPASGQNAKSVLDRIVPGYYHRLDLSGNVTNSTCCDNTATENAMMAKLMIDSVNTLATAYAIDAFRFDLMGHQPKAVMMELQEAVNTATGRNIYLYGEGWNFGEVANNARFEQATQRNMAGTGIGTFNDRIRDMLRGGGAFDGGNQLVQNQGLVNGLYVTDNGSGGNKTLADLLWTKDIAQLGIAASLTEYSFVASNDESKTGEQIDYYGQAAGYTADPQETINYADKHDNQTLYDINGYKLPLATSLANRVRAQNLGYALITLAQGIPFYHGGMDILRSKSYDRDSYNSGDHFNAIDWSLLTNNYGVGAPIADKNQDNWSLIKPRLANAALKPDVTAATNANAGFREWLQIRKSTTLFRLRTAADVKDRLQMLNTGSAQVPGVIAWQINGDGYDGAVYQRVVVVANIDDSAQSLTVAELAGVTLGLHPVQSGGSDAVVKTSSFTSVSGEFTVPARTVAVFVEQ